MDSPLNLKVSLCPPLFYYGRYLLTEERILCKGLS